MSTDVDTGEVVTFHAQVKRIIFERESFVILSVQIDNDTRELLDTRKSYISCKGHLASVPEIGSWAEIQGKVTNNATYGKGIEITSYLPPAPESLDGVEAFLRQLPFIGPVISKRILKEFGENLFTVLDETPKKLIKIPGITPSRVEQIKLVYAEVRADRDALIGLGALGLTPKVVKSLIKSDKSAAQVLQMVRKDPYMLVRNLGFTRADQIALQVGIDANNEARYEAAVLYACVRNEDGRNPTGIKHTLHSIAAIIELASNFLTRDDKELIHVASHRQITQAIHSLEKRSKLVLTVFAGRDFYVLPTRFHQVKQALNILLDKSHQMGIFGESMATSLVIEFCERRGFTPSPTQKDALVMALTRGVSIITGGPGTGKTTCLLVLVAILNEYQIAYTAVAPSGTAAKRLGNAIVGEAGTIHKTLGFNGMSWEYNDKEPLETQYLICDETSMVDETLISKLVSATSHGAPLLLVGDVDQLPSVGAGDVLRDLIDSGLLPYTRLMTIHRQAEGSEIIANAGYINNGEKGKIRRNSIKADGLQEFNWGAIENREKPPYETVLKSKKHRMFHGMSQGEYIKLSPAGYDMRMLRHDTIQIVRYLAREGSFDLSDIQILTPYKSWKQQLSTHWLNKELQDVFNPIPNPIPTYTEDDLCHRMHEAVIDDICWRVGDRVMQTKNVYDRIRLERSVFNGVFGEIVGVWHEKNKPNKVYVAILFDDMDAPHIYDKGDLRAVQHAWAITVHKSQGSEYPCTVIVFHSSQQHFLNKAILYTATTRAKLTCIIMASSQAMAITIKKNLPKRLTVLAALLEQAAIKLGHHQSSFNNDHLEEGVMF